MNYKESPLIGTTWQRCRAVTILNPYPDPSAMRPTAGPQAFFQEEQVVWMQGGRVTLSDVGICERSFSVDGSFALLNPDTGEPTGATATHGDLYALLFSLYMQTAQERDALSGS